MPRPRLMPPMYLLISLAAMLALHFLLPIALIVPSPFNLMGILPLALGLWLNIRADGLFHQASTTVRPGEQSTALVTDGPFRYSRNPMYLGFGVILLGVALLLGSLTPFIVIVVFVVLIERQFIGMEEGMLRQAFGETWDAYARKTRRWI